MERVAERLESGGVARQFEDAQDPHDAEDLDNPACVVDLGGGQSGRLGQRQRHVVRHDRQQVDYVQRRPHIPQPASQIHHYEIPLNSIQYWKCVAEFSV